MEIRFKIFKIAAFIAIGFFACNASCVPEQVTDMNKFANTFATANVKLRGTLLLNEYKDNLTTLTFEQYVHYLQVYEKPSTKDLYKEVEKADKHLFLAQTNTFKVVLYSKKMNAIVFDDANTSAIDSIKLLKKGEMVPDLNSFLKR